VHHDAEIRVIDSVEDLSSVPSRVKPEEMKRGKQVIATFDADLDLKTYKDEYTMGCGRSSTRRSPARNSSHRTSRGRPGSST
jgi:non-homologous end joining protein Ku